MAIINCPECTHKISDQSVSCINCGFPTSKMNFLIKCPDCSESISNQTVSCINCGFPIAKPSPSKDILPSYKELKRLKERNLDKAFEELEEEEYGFFTNTNMFIIGCIIIYFISKDEIDHIFQHVIGLFSN